MLELFVGTLVYKKLLNKLAVIALPHYQFTLTLLGGNDSHNFWSLSLPSPKLTHSLKYSSYNGTKTHLKAHKIERLLGFLSDVCAATYFLCGHLLPPTQPFPDSPTCVTAPSRPVPVPAKLSKNGNKPINTSAKNRDIR